MSPRAVSFGSKASIVSTSSEIFCFFVSGSFAADGSYCQRRFLPTPWKSVINSSQPRFDRGSHELNTFAQPFHFIKKYSTSWHNIQLYTVSQVVDPEFIKRDRLWWAHGLCANKGALGCSPQQSPRAEPMVWLLGPRNRKLLYTFIQRGLKAWKLRISMKQYEVR